VRGQASGGGGGVSGAVAGLRSGTPHWAIATHLLAGAPACLTALAVFLLRTLCTHIAPLGPLVEHLRRALALASLALACLDLDLLRVFVSMLGALPCICTSCQLLCCL
jgi:hypothetical protein